MKKGQSASHEGRNVLFAAKGVIVIDVRLILLAIIPPALAARVRSWAVAAIIFAGGAFAFTCRFAIVRLLPGPSGFFSRAFIGFATARALGGFGLAAGFTLGAAA